MDIYKEELQKYNCRDITNLILDYAQYEKISTIDNYGYKLFGEKEGKWGFWYENRNKKEEGEYKNGLKEGKWTIWDYNGNKQNEGEYKNGEKEGKWTSWHENENKYYEGEYKNGLREGNWTIYKNGKIYCEEEYIKGERIN